MRKEYENLIEKLKKEHAELLAKFQNAGVADMGDYSNKIDEKAEKIKQLEKKLVKYEDVSSPEEAHVHIFILTGLQHQIVESVGDKLASHLPPDRNDCKCYEKWKPYLSDSKDIDELLVEFKEKEGYVFSATYLDEMCDGQLIVKMDDCICNNNAVAIVDLLAINERNNSVAQRFDTINVRQLLLPICEDLHSSLRKFMKKKRQEVFQVAEAKLKSRDCCFFEAPAENDFFIQQLKRCFPAKGKIANQIGGINNGLPRLNNQLS